jgi:hypothetical protein
MMMSLETVRILIVAASSGSCIGEKNPIEGLPGLKGPKSDSLRLGPKENPGRPKKGFLSSPQRDELFKFQESS